MRTEEYSVSLQRLKIFQRYSCRIFCKEGAFIVPTSYEYKVIYIEITAPCRWIGNYHRRFC